MRKYQSDVHGNAPRSGRSRLPAAIALGLALLASPLVYEAGQLLVGQWLSMTGSYRAPHTPILSTINEWSRSATVDGHRRYDRFFNSGPWSTSSAVPLGIGWAVLMVIVFLRRVR